MARILVVEDALDALELATATLASAGHQTFSATTAKDARSALASRNPEIVLLDLGLPDGEGTDLCTEIRARSDAFVVMLTSRDDEVDKVLGLKLGADDYVTKPYSPRELLARIEAIMRRSQAATTSNERVVGDLVVDPIGHRVLVDGEPVALTRTEFGLLEALTERPDQVLSRAQLRERVWGDRWAAGEHSLDVHIANLRRKIDLGEHGHIHTVRGVGYRMAEMASLS